MSRSEVEEKTFASEAGHYYWPDGRTAYEVPNASKGGMRPTTLRDARKLNLLPSVTGIMKIMGKGDALSNWYKRQVAMAAYDLGAPGELESREEYVNHLLDQAEKNMTKQRDQGSKDHGEVEAYFRQLVNWEDEPNKIALVNARFADSKPVEAVILAMDKLEFTSLIDSEKSFASPMGYGGKIDISGRNEMWIADFKFVDRLEKKKDYVEKVAQGAAYLVGRYGIGGLKGRFANIFVETNTYCYEVREWTQEEIMHGWSIFEACFKLWKIINKYEPA